MSIRPPRTYRSAQTPAVLREIAVIAVLCTLVAVPALRVVLRAMDISNETNGARLVNLLTEPVVWVLCQVPSLDGTLIGNAQFADALLLFGAMAVTGFGLATIANRRPLGT